MTPDGWTVRAIRLASDLPEGLGTAERASWLVRGLAEIALFVLGHDWPPDPIDEAVAEVNLDGQWADPRYCSRLTQLRALIGPAPRSYYRLGSDHQRPLAISTPSGPAIAGYCQLADFLAPTSARPPGVRSSAADGSGSEAIKRWSNARPGGFHASTIRFLPRCAPADLAWRTWTLGPDGAPTIALIDEMLDQPTTNVWWGIHNGSHIDHLAHLRPPRGPSVLEYGFGLLVAESWAMSNELLLGLESDDEAIRAVIWEGLVERLARLPIPKGVIASPTIAAARRVTSEEFTVLPTLAAAYTTGAIDLIVRRFNDPLVPPSMRDSANARWDALTERDPRISVLLEELR